MSKVAFIGLGTMGFPMAAHLSRAAHQVCVFNRTQARAQAWLEENGGSCAQTPAQASVDAEIVFSCVGNDDDLRAVTMGEDGALSAMSRGCVFVDHTTTSAEVAAEVAAQASRRGIEFIDAPVSGGQSGAENGVLTVMCGGREHAFERVRPVIESYARTCILMGEVGAGQLTKAVNQICIAGLLQGLAEGMNFGVRAGLDMEKVVAVISNGAAQSWQMDNRAASMLANEFEFGFAIDWMRKDLGIAIDAAERFTASLPVTQIVNEYYGELQSNGANRLDTSALIKRLSDSSVKKP